MRQRDSRRIAPGSIFIVRYEGGAVPIDALGRDKQDNGGMWKAYNIGIGALVVLMLAASSVALISAGKRYVLGDAIAPPLTQTVTKEARPPGNTE